MIFYELINTKQLRTATARCTQVRAFHNERASLAVSGL